MDKNTPKEDLKLVARLREPSTCREAFGDVIKLYSETLYWQIRRMVNNHDDANDLLQNTFMKAWGAIENFRGDELPFLRPDIGGIQAHYVPDGDIIIGTQLLQLPFHHAAAVGLQPIRSRHRGDGTAGSQQ